MTLPRLAATVLDGDRAKAVAFFRSAVDADPQLVNAYEQFISATQSAAFAYDAAKGAGDEDALKRATTELKALYENWAAAHHDNPVYEWALATIAGKDRTAAEAHLQRAIAIVRRLRVPTRICR